MVKNKADYLLFLILAGFWSGSFIGIKVVVLEWPPLFSAAVRVALALLCISVFMFCTKRSFYVPLTMRWKTWIVGLFSQGLPFCFLFIGERFISPGLAGIINGTVSLWAFILMLIFLPSACTDTPQKTAGLCLGLVGVVIIFWPMLVLKSGTAEIGGTLSVFAMAIAYAIGAVLNQYFLTFKSKLDFFANIFHQYCASMLFLFFISFLFEKWPTLNMLTADKSLWVANIYLGVFSTAIAFIIYYHLIREWDAVRASAVMYVVPIMTLVWDFLFFANTPRISELLGIVVILSGVVLIQFPKLFSRFFPLLSKRGKAEG